MAADTGAFTLLSYYAKAYEGRHGRKPRMNRYRDKWGMKDLMEDLDIDSIKGLIDYYLSLDRGDHPLVWFYNNYDRLAQQKEARDADRAYRLALAQRTKRRMNDDGRS